MSETTNDAPAAEPRKRPLPQKITDNELQTMAAVNSLLSALDEDERGRVMVWLWNQHMGTPCPGEVRIREE